MKLSDKTISVLKNFSSINQSILFKEGNRLRTISVMKNILAEATISDEFAKDFGVYDLNQFLNGLSLHQRPELDFGNDGYVVIREGKMRSKYFFADPNVIVTPPDKEITLPSEDVYFEVERKLRFGFTNNNSKVIRGVILLVTDNQFDNTILTNGRQIRQLIDSSCFQQFVQLFSAHFKAHIFRRKSDLFVRRSDNDVGISKEIL